MTAAATTTKRFPLRDEEATAVDHHSKRHGFIPVVEWHAGPRGRRFRPVRGEVRPTLTEATRDGDALSRRFNAIPARITVYRVNSSGRVLDSTVTYG